MAKPFRGLVRPLLTEKSSAAMAEKSEYAFVADPSATKPQIASAIEQMFDVKVEKVRTMIQPAKRKTMGRYVGRRPKWKKAIVTLKEGDTIEMFEG